MKKSIGMFLLGSTFFISLQAFDFDIGLSSRDGKVDGFSFAIGDYYQVPHRDVMLFEQNFSRNDINVAYFLAKHSRKSVKYIMSMHQNGKSWWDVSLHLGLNPRTLYIVDTYNDYGPPYGKAYGYNKRDKNYRLDDRHISELVNVRFLSDYHRISPDEAIEKRSKKNDKHKRIKNNNHQERYIDGDSDRKREKSKRNGAGNFE